MKKEREQTDTTVEESGITKTKKPIPIKLIIGGVVIFLVVVSGIVFMANNGNKPAQPAHTPTAADQAQQKADADKAEREQRQVEGLRDQDFFMRDERAESTISQIFRGLTTEAPKTNFSWEGEREEEEAINYILNSTAAKTQAQHDAEKAAVVTTGTATAAAYPQNYAARQAQDNNNNSTPPPMFVYSRNFGGARYTESKPGQQSRQAGQNNGQDFPFTDDELLRMALGLTTPAAVEATAEATIPASNLQTTALTDKPTQLIYTAHPPVVVNEGEMLEAALVNRLIVNVEPSPVVCVLSRDLFDRSGKYVIFPANSYVLGTAQAVGYKGASRLFISFHKIILPSGLSVDLPQSRRMMRAMDETGAIGVVSHVNRHWMLQFGAAIMLGVFDGVAGLAQRNNQTTTAEGMILGRTSENFGRILDRVMDSYSSIMPTISVFQGKTMRIYVSDDMVISPYSLITDRSYYNGNR